MDNHGFDVGGGSRGAAQGSPPPRSQPAVPMASMSKSQVKASSARARTSSIASSVTNATSAPPNDPQRPLPERNITSENIEDAYVDFVFYCNPFLSTSIDTTELRKGFNSLPKTDGKTFSALPLFHLIRKLEAKEIETWAQLVVDMGVKPPDVASGQSTQKVQQYAVRLKRWLHAYHIDAFFQYCLGKSNSYFTDIPQISEISETTIRDGVPPEEDLAIRALLPEWRPKRGRRAADDGARGSPSAKRQMRAASLTADDHIASAVPLSAYPHSAYPWDRQSNSTDAWAAAQRALAPRAELEQGGRRSHPHQAHISDAASDAAQQPALSIEGQLSFAAMETEPELYPRSAVHTRPPSSAFPHSAAPHSAHPAPPAHSAASPSPRPRKRHGPHVSAAWAPDGAASKARGRPPANRSTQDGPFGTFPARASATPATPAAGTPAGLTPAGMTPAGLTPAAAHAAAPAPPTPQSSQSHQAPPSAQQPTPSTAHTATTADSPFSQPRRPSKLQLQVPQHAGGPVRLATPPRVVLNGAMEGAAGPATTAMANRMERRSSADFFASLDADELRSWGGEGDADVDWKRRATALARRVRELEAELKAVKRRVLEAVM